MEVRRYSQDTIEDYISVVQMASQFFKQDLNMENEKGLHLDLYSGDSAYPAQSEKSLG